MVGRQLTVGRLLRDLFGYVKENWRWLELRQWQWGQKGRQAGNMVGRWNQPTPELTAGLEGETGILQNALRSLQSRTAGFYLDVGNMRPLVPIWTSPCWRLLDLLKSKAYFSLLVSVCIVFCVGLGGVAEMPAALREAVVSECGYWEKEKYHVKA